MNNKDICNELKILALEAINNAGSGHSGMVISSAEILYTLYTKHLIADTTQDMLRDRFVMSNGHGCALLYSILAGLKYFSIGELKGFRKYGRMLTGHPEIATNGIDAATGPLGQGVSNAVGMAIAETILNARFGLDHYTYCLVGDGCLEEGVGQESLSIAGLHKLNKFILLYDKNNITLDGSLDKSNTEDISLKFKAMNFNVIECDGHNISEIDKAINFAKKSKCKPTAIICNTIIAKDTSLENSHLAHGKVFDNEELSVLRKKLKVNSPNLDLSDKAKEILAKIRQEVDNEFVKRKIAFNEILKADKQLVKQYKKFISNDYTIKNKKYKTEDISTRDANNIVLNELSKSIDNLICLSADLSSSTKVRINEGGDYSNENRLGRNIAVGIREHAMGGIANGIALHGGLNVICSTFLSFSNYMLPPIRMACMMDLRVMFTFTHASVADTSDGTTHIPVEQLDQLRLIPNIIVSRPCDVYEVEQSYKWYFENKQPTCLILSRNALPTYPKNDKLECGAYAINDTKADIDIMSSGSEVCLAMQTKDVLKEKGINARVISVPSIEIFDRQNKIYKNKLISDKLFVIESSTCMKYLRWTNEEKIFNVTDFGVSGDIQDLKKHYNYNGKYMADEIEKLLKNNKK